MKADAAWQALEAKGAGRDHEYKDCAVWALIATLPTAVCPPGADPACMLPAEVRPAGGTGGVRAAAAGWPSSAGGSVLSWCPAP